MASLSELLGAKLLGKNGEVATDTAMKDKKAIALYFSAHWCPPCRGFTPKFAEWYTKDLQKKGLEVVFVSSDKDEKQFKEYYSEQPWLSLPFDDKETNAKLNKKYKVQGIPSVVILGPTGELITKDGRAAVSQDPTGEEMPWKPKTLEEIFSDAKLVGSGGIEKQGKDLKGTVFGLYFSAHWCPPCRGFTPKLAEWYQTSLRAKGFEIVFVSSDKDEGQFKEYFAEQPWLALDFTDRKRKEQLSKAMNVEGIPSFVIVDKDGSVITKDGRAAVTEDPTGGEFPWYPKPVSNLKSGPGSMNETPTVVAFCETADAATKTAIEKSMEPIAGKYLAEAKAAGEETPEVGFMIVTEKDGMAERVRTMLNLQKCGDKPSPSKLMLVDIPDDGGYYEGPEGEITEPIVRKLVDDYLAKKLERKQLE
jgi:nucleoredoxin